MLLERANQVYFKMAQKIKYYAGVRSLKKFIIEDNFEPTVNSIPNGNKLCIIVPGVTKFSGGMTSILRLGTNLSKLGYEVTYISMLNESIDKMKDAAKLNLSDYQGDFVSISNVNYDKYDIILATMWQTAYEARKFRGYKMYFVQDYEPYFYEYGDYALLAQKTYELGLHIVSLGSWNKKIIERNCKLNGKIDCIDFPYERKEYSFTERDFSYLKTAEKIKIAVYIKEEAKRLPIIIPMLMDCLKKDLKESGIEIDILYFGNGQQTSIKNGKSLGKMPKAQLAELYNTCDFGLVASLTNVSLVPYEMVASGLPIIEFIDGTFSDFFMENSCVMTDLNYKKLSNDIQTLIKNPDKISQMTKNAYNSIKDLSWEKSALQFDEILKNAKLSEGEF